MAKPKRGLGRGLDSLFEDSTPGTGGEGVSTLPLRDIEPDREQPRKVFEDDSMTELSESIRQHGLLQPIAVRPIPGGAGYRIIAGERRWRAARMAGLTEVPVVIKDVSEEEARELALIENLQREDLDPVEEAEGIRQLMEKCQLTQEAAAEKLGRSRSAVANSLRLLKLPQEVLTALQKGDVSTGHAKVLLGLAEQPEKLVAAARIVMEQGLNVRQTEALCKKLSKEPAEAKPPRKTAPLATEVELALREVIGNEVKVNYKRGGKGTLTVHFYSDRQLMDFANLLGHYDKDPDGLNDWMGDEEEEGEEES